MPKKTTAIPVNSITGRFGMGIGIERQKIKDIQAPVKDSPKPVREANQSHRHDAHSFFLLESGSISIEIDFKMVHISPSSVIYIHPDQVHRIIKSKNLMVSSWAISNENLNPGYPELLMQLVPAQPLRLKKEDFTLFSDAVSLAVAFSARTSDKLHPAILKDSCNALVALIISLYARGERPGEKLSRADISTRAFRKFLEENYRELKRPQQYAKKINISTAYLNECVKRTTGNSVSYHIQERIILEAKRMLYHSDKSVKEIAADLGYIDYPYFSRLFTRVTKLTALTFRAKNRV